MQITDTSGKGLETLIVESLVSAAGYVQGRSEDYDRDHAMDLTKLLVFVRTTQLQAAEVLGMAEGQPEADAVPAPS